MVEYHSHVSDQNCKFNYTCLVYVYSGKRCVDPHFLDLGTSWR
jgi:hypothetical protein